MKISKNNSESESLEKTIDEFLSLYSTVSLETDFFNSSRKRLDGLKHRMANDQVRIALIGITSSGKSSLLNRILGDELLPTGVKPSSSQQVICGYDKILHANIIFKDEMKKEPLVVTKDIQKTLSKYGDEKYNPNNKYGIEEIHVYSPNFKFNQNLIFVDTPGLDAYNLGHHEEVTLKMSLPQVDMVLFLTNVKCDSDKKNLDIIDKVTTDSKPLVVVQNKIDSIEPKISKLGVEKTTEQVKNDHYNRIKKLLSEAQKESVRRAPIVQVSAKNPNWINSNLDELKRVLDEQLKFNSSFKEKRFHIQLYRELHSIYESVKNNLGDADKKGKNLKDAKEKIKKWDKHFDDAQDTFLIREKKIYEYGEIVEEECNKLFTIIDEYGCKKIEGRLPFQIEQSCGEFQQYIEEASKYFSDTISIIEKKLEVCCNDMNLQREQIIKKEHFFGVSVAISDYEETEEIEVDNSHYEKVPVKGFKGGLQRFVGWFTKDEDLGYEQQYVRDVKIETRTKVDLVALKKQLAGAYNQFADFLNKQYDGYRKNTKYSLNCLIQEINNRRQEITNLYSCKLPVSIAEKVISHLEKYVQKNHEELIISQEQFQESSTDVVNNVVRKEYVDPMKGFTEAELDELILNSFYYASAISLSCHYALVEDIIKNAHLENVYICGWDIEKLEQFRMIFWQNPEDVDIIDFNYFEGVLPRDSLIFLLVNSDQTGTIRGKLYNSGKVSEILFGIKEFGKIVWVMDSVKALVNSDGLMEAFEDITCIIREFMKEKQVYEVMACDRELYYTVLLHEVLFNTELCSKEKKRQNFVCEMEKLFHLSNERVHMTGHYINEFNKLRKEGDI